MRLPCKVIEDILPIYYDGICSKESAEFVEEHLRSCRSCRETLSNLQWEMEPHSITVDDMKPLEVIQQQWIQGKRACVIKGICIALVVLAVIFTILTGVWYWSYARFYKDMTTTMERTSDEEKFTTSSDYMLKKDGVTFEVWLPIVLSDCGFSRVMDKNGLILFLYRTAGGGCKFWLLITDDNNQTWPVHIRYDMTPDFENQESLNRTDKEKEYINQLVSDRIFEISAMFDAVKTVWGIELLGNQKTG